MERYLPKVATDGLADSVARATRCCADSGRGATQVHYLQSIYVPSEDTCFCLFRATSPDAIRAVNAAANFALDRITQAVVLLDRAPNGPAGRSDPTHA